MTVEPGDAGPPIERLSMVYDADGGVAGEARYVVGHLLGRTHCDLCDITHGPVRRKGSFDRLLADLRLPVEVLHRNEQDPALAAATSGKLACVVAHGAAGPQIIVTRDELAACDGDVVLFGTLLRDRLEGRTSGRARDAPG